MEVDRGFDLKPKAGNRKCEHCDKSFYANDSTQRGSKRRYCSLKCRNAAYHNRQVLSLKNSKSQVNSLRTENDKLKAALKELEHKYDQNKYTRANEGPH